ncbi:TEX45 protein, partial [Oreotrochilus melanogaster]|nr:TEX45 protein [Oreotrochilus melanogaster]
FLKASHIQLGAERGLPGGAHRPLSHIHFPPIWGFHRPAPAPQPPKGQPGVRMHADPRIRVLNSTMRESFPWPHAPLHRPPLPTPSKDNIPCGDREKIKLPPSLYSLSYPAPKAQPVVRPSPQGCFPTIPRSAQPSYNTSYQEAFKGVWNPTTKPGEKHVSAVKFGDPRISDSISEQKYSYGAPEKGTHRACDKELAASQVHHTNLKLGDGCTRFSTSTSEHFPAHNPEPVTIVHPDKYSSSIPRGDEDPERIQALARTTTTQLSYPKPDRYNLTPKPQGHQSSICLGDKHSCFFSTTQQADYSPPEQSQRVTADSKSHHESHIPFNYHNESPVTTTQAMLVPHRLQKQQLSEDVLQQIKCSHLGLPWKTQGLFRTEQKDEFTPKFRGPAEIQKGDCQVSCVPLGTLKRYCPQRKVHFAP